MNVLFVCSRNLWRSPTAEEIYKNRPDLNVRSAGTAPSARIKITAKTVVWADIIFVMEKTHRDRIKQKFPLEATGKQIVVLDIHDDYKFMDEFLIDEIKIKVDNYFKP